MLLRNSLYLALLAFQGHASSALGLRQSDDEGDPFRARDRQSMAVMGDFLYIEGGRISEYYNGVKDGDAASLGLSSTFAIPLANSWDNATVNLRSFYKSAPGPIGVPALWADEESKVLYRWGGRKVDNTPISHGEQGDAPTLWGLTGASGGSGEWKDLGQPPREEDGVDDIYAVAQGAWAACGGKGLVAGGFASSATDARLDDEMAQPGLVMYDFNDHGWDKVSTAPLNSPDGTLINTAGLCLANLATDPLFFVIGGTDRSPTDMEDSEPRSFENITFFDMGTRTWHWQVAEGAVPRAREHFCAAGQQGHNGTYEIFVYGGIDPHDENARALNDVHILSIPGFQWFQVDATSTPARTAPACTAVRGGQIAVSGGLAVKEDFKTQDVWQHTLGIFDMGALEWSDGYDAAMTEYKTPQVIRDWYNEGNLDSVNWIGGVERFFLTDDGGDDGDGGGADDAEGVNGDDENSGEPDSTGTPNGGTPTGVIVGSVVGCVLGLALLGALSLFFLRRRRRRAQLSEKKPSAPVELDPAPLPVELASSSSPEGLLPGSPSTFRSELSGDADIYVKSIRPLPSL